MCRAGRAKMQHEARSLNEKKKVVPAQPKRAKAGVRMVGRGGPVCRTPNAEGREGRNAGTPVQRGSAGLGRRDEFMQVCPERAASSVAVAEQRHSS